jgi:aminodeoxyfutalosine deaminase
VCGRSGEVTLRLVFPKIELHVHLEGTIRPNTLLDMARRNNLPLPVETQQELAALYQYRDFRHFIDTWIMTTNVTSRAKDFQQVVVDYAAEASSQGAVYIEGCITPGDRASRGVAWDEILSGYCDGIEEARERFGVEVRLTPEIARGDPEELAEQTTSYAIRYRDRGVVGLGLGGLETEFPPDAYASYFQRARAAGLGSVPHAGEAAGSASIRGALDCLGADRIRHGIRAIEDDQLVAELGDRGTVLDVCLVSNLRTGVVPSLAVHPLPALITAGVRCSLSTDDPAMMDTDLVREYAAARSLGVSPRALFEAGVTGALCDQATRQRLRQVGETFDWNAVAAD